MHKPSPSIPCVNVAAGIIWQNDTFLIALRPQGKPRGGYWEFPGGKQEAGESMETALHRELQEELGIDAQTIIFWKKIFHPYADLHVHLHFMHVTHFLGTPQPKEGQTLRWTTMQEALSLNFLPADRELLPFITHP